MGGGAEGGLVSCHTPLTGDFLCAVFTVLELRASFMRFSAAVMSSWTEAVSVNLREFRWSWTFTHIRSIICSTGHRGQRSSGNHGFINSDQQVAL